MDNLFKEVVDVIEGAYLKEFLVVAQGDAEGVLQARDEVNDVQTIQLQVFEYAFFRGQNGWIQLEFVNKDLVDDDNWAELVGKWEQGFTKED